MALLVGRDDDRNLDGGRGFFFVDNLRDFTDSCDDNPPTGEEANLAGASDGAAREFIGPDVLALEVGGDGVEFLLGFFEGGVGLGQGIILAAALPVGGLLAPAP